MKFVATISTDNAVFDGDSGAELARILHKLAEGLERDGYNAPVVLLDANGNNVGKWELKEEGIGDRLKMRRDGRA